MTSICPVCSQLREVYGPLAVCEEHGYYQLQEWAKGLVFEPGWKPGMIVSIGRADAPSDALALESIGQHFLDNIEIAFGRLPRA